MTLEKAEQLHSELKKAEDEKNPDAKEDAQLGEKIEEDVVQHLDQNPAAHQEEGRFKGHIKLSKFIGYIQGKKSAKGMNQDSGNNTPTQPVDNVGPGINPPKKLN